MKHANVWMRLSLLAMLLLASGCGTKNSRPTVTIAPTLFGYSGAFQNKAADEMEAMPAACDRIEPIKPCSAVKRSHMDHGTVRDQIRAGKP